MKKHNTNYKEPVKGKISYNTKLQLEAQLVKYQNELHSLMSTPKTVSYNGGWEDTELDPSVIYDKEEYDRIVGLILLTKKMLENNEVVDSLDNDELIDIGDSLLVNLIDDEGVKTMVICIADNPNEYDDAMVITLNGPLGKALYQQPLFNERNHNIYSYEVVDKRFNKVNKKLVVVLGRVSKANTIAR